MLHQPFPTTGMHLDLGNASLAQMIEGESDAVYAYVMSTVVLERNQLRQLGTGPNLQGGYITLCTCKHRMRTSLSCEDWPNKWIAGFTSLDCGRRHWLFYLAQVKAAYESQAELWYSGLLSDPTLKAKSARHSTLGDLYEPKSELGPVYDPSNYHTPIPGHRHHKTANDHMWQIDIDYSRKNLKVKAKRQPSLLVCDPAFRFLWREPRLYVEGSWRQTIYDGLDDFLQDLNESRLRSHDEAGCSIARRC
jgi:hypothetical protein